jgi:hypothetical protein
VEFRKPFPQRLTRGYGVIRFRSRNQLTGTRARFICHGRSPPSVIVDDFQDNDGADG